MVWSLSFPARIKHLYFQVNALFEENNVLNEENKRLMRQYYREKHNSGSSGGSASGKVSNLSGVWLYVFIYLSIHELMVFEFCYQGKRKSSPKMSIPAENKIDLSDENTLRQPLSPLQFNSPESRMHKK